MFYNLEETPNHIVSKLLSNMINKREESSYVFNMAILFQKLISHLIAGVPQYSLDFGLARIMPLAIIATNDHWTWCHMLGLSVKHGICFWRIYLNKMLWLHYEPALWSKYNVPDNRINLHACCSIKDCITLPNWSYLAMTSFSLYLHFSLASNDYNFIHISQKFVTEGRIVYQYWFR